MYQIKIGWSRIVKENTETRIGISNNKFCFIKQDFSNILYEGGTKLIETQAQLWW